jgi:quercetin dioxygenase-like cupin family protein
MTASERRRPHPIDRFAGAEHALDLTTALRALRAEGPFDAHGHRQIALLHHGPLRLVLYAFAPAGRIPEHRAPGWVTIHVLRGALTVRTPDARHMLHEGQILSLAPNVAHDVEAGGEADMLLGVYPESPVNSAASP